MTRFFWFAIVLFAGLAFFSWTATATPLTFDPVTWDVNGHTYQVIPAGNWTTAEDGACASGGTLVTINDEAEQQWLEATFGTDDYYWIGLFDPVDDGHANFVWVSGESPDYTNWVGVEPNLPEHERWAFMNWRYGDQIGWGNSNMWFASYGIVEIGDSTQVPEPGAVAVLGFALLGLTACSWIKRD